MPAPNYSQTDIDSATTAWPQGTNVTYRWGRGRRPGTIAGPAEVRTGVLTVPVQLHSARANTDRLTYVMVGGPLGKDGLPALVRAPATA